MNRKEFDRLPRPAKIRIAKSIQSLQDAIDHHVEGMAIEIEREAREASPYSAGCDQTARDYWESRNQPPRKFVPSKVITQKVKNITAKPKRKR